MPLINTILKPVHEHFRKRVGLGQEWYLIALAAAIGAVTAFGAIGFIRLVEWAAHSTSGLYKGLPWWTLPLLPMVGGLIAGTIIFFFAREAKGHGVPEVIDSLVRKKGRIRPRVAVAKALASAATIGSGGSAGAEGPIVQIGSALGSGLAQLVRLPRDQGSTLLGCGAAAGIASVFNAPFAGMFFVLEILLRDYSVRTVIPIAIASVLSTAVTHAVVGGNAALFDVTTVLGGYQFTIGELPSYLALGLVCGMVAVMFIRVLYWSEDVWDEKVKLHPIAKPVVGGLLLGLLGFVYIWAQDAFGFGGVYGQADGNTIPAFFGNGYETIRMTLDPQTYIGAVELASAGGDPYRGVSIAPAVPAGLFLLIALFVGKVVATSLTLGSGGSGGVFAPSLFMGAVAGGALGVALERLGVLPASGSPATYALVGMAAVVAATTHGPLTAILILFELTRDYYVLLPIMLAAMLATLTARYFERDSIYSLKLRRRGVLLGTAADLTLLRKLTAREVNPEPHVEVQARDPLTKLIELQDSYRIADFVVVDERRKYIGMVTAHDMRTALIEREAIPYLLVEELMRSDLPTVDAEESLDRLVEKFARHDVGSFALVSGAGESQGRVTGLITRARFMHRYQQALKQTT